VALLATLQLQSAPGTFSSGYGGTGYQVIGQVSGVLKAVDGLKSLSNPTIGASLMLGASGSSSWSQARSLITESISVKANTFGTKVGLGLSTS
jgi:hypothetical protein